MWVPPHFIFLAKAARCSWRPKSAYRRLSQAKRTAGRCADVGVLLRSSRSLAAPGSYCRAMPEEEEVTQASPWHVERGSCCSCL